MTERQHLDSLLCMENIVRTKELPSLTHCKEMCLVQNPFNSKKYCYSDRQWSRESTKSSRSLPGLRFSLSQKLDHQIYH
jgi:hypothetical protein